MIQHSFALMKKLFLLVIIVIFFLGSFAQSYAVEQYIRLHKDLAVREMKRMGVPAAITLAQGLLETENGNSDLVKKSNNHFGIKCKSSWTAEGVSHDDDAPGECFRSYKDAEASYRDHSNYLRGNERYAILFRLDPLDYRGWALGLKRAGYATNPRYPDILIKSIEDNNLQQYSLLAVKDIPKFDASKYKSDPEEKEISQITGKAPADILKTDEKITINGSRALLAHKGRSLLAIATDNNINLSRLLEFNELHEDGILQNDQVIFLERKPKEGDKDYYIVQKESSLYELAQKNGIRLQSIIEFNKLKPGQVPYAGQKIYLRNSMNDLASVAKNEIKKEQVKPENFKKELPDVKRIHFVQQGEGLYGISRKYGITITQLKEWNNLLSDNLQVGQELIISK